jgi:hypothetical protein
MAGIAKRTKFSNKSKDSKRYPKGYWENQQNQKDFLESLAKQLRIKHLSDWYKVSLRAIEKVSTKSLFSKFGKAGALISAYPQYPWDLEKLQSKSMRNSRASQSFLAASLVKIFPSSGESDIFFI